MSEKRIVGVDIGSYAIKVVYLDPKATELAVLGYTRELVTTAAPTAPVALGASAEEARPSGPPPVPGTDESFEDAPTGVHEPPNDADETTEQADEQAAASIEFSAAPDWVAALQRLRDRDALLGELQATAIPDSNAVLIELEVPFEDKAKVQNILPHLMVDRLPLAQSEITWDFQTYPDDTAEGARALVAFARNEDIESALQRFAEVGLDPAQLGIAELQLATIGAQLVAPDGVTAFVDLGHELTRVAVVTDSAPLLGRTVRSGGRQITEAIRAKFEGTYEEAENVKHQYGAILDDANAPNPDMKRLSDAIQDGMKPIVRNLRRTFQGLFARKRIEVKRVFICGGTSQIKNLEKYLSAELGLPVRRLSVTTPGMTDGDAGAVGLLALGAALTQQNEVIRNHAVNLRNGRFAYRGRSSYLRRQLMFAGVAILGLLMVLGLTLYMQKASYEAQRDAMKSALQKQTKVLLGTELTTKSAIQKVMEGEDTGGTSYIPNMSAYHLLHELTVKLPKDVTITLDRIEVDTDRNLIQVYGETTDAQAVDRIVSALEQGIECLKEIKKDKLKVRDDKADFELQISSGCS